MKSGNFGTFAQWMFDAGLVFDIKFEEDEVEKLPSWSLFDRKIMDGLSSLAARIQLPPRLPKFGESVNTTLWTFVSCPIQSIRGQFGRQSYHLVPLCLYPPKSGPWTS